MMRRAFVTRVCVACLVASCHEAHAEPRADDPGLGIAEQPVIPEPAHFERYCSRTNGSTWELAWDPSDPTPCSTALGGAGTIRRAGLWENRPFAYNGVVARCTSGPPPLKHRFYGLGASALAEAETWASAGARGGCFFTVAPRGLPVFQRPVSYATMVNIEPTGRGVDLAYHVEFLPGACFPAPVASDMADYRGHGDEVFGVNNSNHAGYDWTDADEWLDPSGNSATWGVYAAAAGTVVVRRFRKIGSSPGLCSAPGPLCQAEVYLQHTVGSGDYAESFVTYYAHLDSIAVSLGASVTKGQYLGEVGGSGCNGCPEHLHFGVFRLSNTSIAWRHDWEDLFGEGQHDERTCIDPFGYQPACVDPWGYNFSDKGAISIRLWEDTYPELDWDHH